jgi:hypothetical protein
MGAIIQIIIGLFVWMALPPLLLGKKKLKKYKRFINIACKILGIVIIVFGVWNGVKQLYASFLS